MVILCAVVGLFLSGVEESDDIKEFVPTQGVVEKAVFE